MKFIIKCNADYQNIYLNIIVRNLHSSDFIILSKLFVKYCKGLYSLTFIMFTIIIFNMSNQNNIRRFKVGPPYFYPIWMTFWALFHIIILIQIHFLSNNGTSSRGSVTWYVDLTSWTYISIVLSSTVDCVISVFVHTLRRYLLEISAGK